MTTVRENDGIVEAFEQGNFTRVILQGSPEDWKWYAALGLIGRTDEALAGLPRFRNPEARFYEGVAYWMAGDEIEAKRVLAEVPTPHAQRLLKLISKPVVRVLAMMPHGLSGTHLVYRGALADPKFEIFNILPVQNEYRDTDEDCARVFESARPDFFLCQMLEWHQLPLRLAFFECPTISQTSDFDLHIHGVHGWLRAFDELLVSDHDEHDAASKLTNARISTFPKTFACPQSLPRPLRRERFFDVFLSGTLFHPWHPDKARLIHQLLGEEGLRFLGFNGYLPEDQYFESLARSRMCVAYYRRGAGLLTRALESAAMGCVTLVPQGSVINFYTKPKGTLVEYNAMSADGLLRAVKAVLDDYDLYEQRAWKGAADFRRELGAELVGSQYLRFCTFLATRPRPPRPAVAPYEADQRQMVILKGWLPAGGKLEGMRKLAAKNIRLWRRSLRSQPDRRFAAVNNILRERLLIFLRLLATSRFPQWQSKPFDISRSDFPRPGVRARLLSDYRRACAEHPERLVLIFNYLRAAIHVGSESQLADALRFLTATLAHSSDHWRVDFEDDVFSYDVFPLCFNYRRYLDTVCECIAETQTSSAQLVTLILASLFHYRARLLGAIDDARKACALDPDFPYFALDLAKRLASSEAAQDHREARGILVPLIEKTMVASEAWAVLSPLGGEGDTAPLAARVRRIEDGLIASEQYLWDSHNILSAIQTPRLNGWLGPRLLQNAKESGRPSRFSVLFTDQAFRNWRHYAELMNSQSIARSEYESIVADVSDQVPTGASGIFDRVILCGQYDFLAHETAAANYAALSAQSNVFLIIDGVPDVAADTFSLLAREIELGHAQAVIASAGGGSILACSRESFSGWLGLDEDTTYAGSGTIVGALCQRLAASGVKVLVLTGQVPEVGQSSTRRDFLKIVQESKTGARRNSRLLPSLPNELIRARASHHDLLHLISLKPIVRSLPNGCYVPRLSPQGPVLSVPRVHLNPGHYRLTWTAELNADVAAGILLFDVDVIVDEQVVTADSLTTGGRAITGFIDFVVAHLPGSGASVCAFNIENRSAAGWILTGIWLQALDRMHADLSGPASRGLVLVSSSGGTLVGAPVPHRRSFAKRVAGLWGALRHGLPPDFDRGAYLRLNPDVAKANVDPVQHFQEYGYREGRRWTDR